MLALGLAYGESPCQPSLDFYVGWQGGQKQTLTSSSDGPYPGALYRFSQLEVPNRGVWLGASANANANWGCDLRLSVQGWYFLPTDTEGSILLDPGATPRQIPAGVSSNVDWWYVDAFGALRLRSSFAAILGLRFDHHNYYTEDPELLNIIFFPLTNQMRLDLNVVSTIPYFGLQWGPSSGLTLRALYSPLGWINVESTLSQNNSIFRPQNWLGGQSDLTTKEFFEVFGEYAGQVTPFAQLGIFARGTWLNGRTNTSLSESLVNGSAEYSVSYRSASWTIGCKAAVNFDFPRLWNGW
jgi:hypothetical protein